jgi:hypothetical protein
MIDFLEFHYTPKYSSWLKMAEIESPFSSAMRRQVTAVEQNAMRSGEAFPGSSLRAMHAASWSGSIQ